MRKYVARGLREHARSSYSLVRAKSGYLPCWSTGGRGPRWWLITCLLVAWVAGVLSQLTAQEEAASAALSAQPVMAATVNGEPIHQAEIFAQVRQSLGGRETTQPAETLLQAEALQLLIDRQLVLASLRQRGEAADDQEVELELDRLKASLARHEQTLESYCQSHGLHPTSLRRQLLWQLSWQRCLAKYQTEANLQRYFERHKRDFDGTRVRVAQILLRNESPAKPDPTSESESGSMGESERVSLLARAAEIRQEIVQNSISFADAARKYSQSPSAAAGGELEWITREGPMSESFTRTALALDVGEISQPLVSPFGVHLIQCLEIQPGTRSWQDAREELVRAAAEYLFRWLADQARPAQNIHFTGVMPYFEPGSRRLILPAQTAPEPVTPSHEPTRK